MSNRLYSMIGKYAALLSIFYLISYAFRWAANSYEFPLSFNLSESTFVRATAPTIFDLLLNVVSAFIIHHDITKSGVRTKYVVLSTVLYRPLGIVAFLLFLILQTTGITPASQWNESTSDPDILDQ